MITPSTFACVRRAFVLALALVMLAALPEVREDDYYRLSTRFEVIQIAFAALRSEMERAGVEATEYEPEDYQEALGQA